MPYAILAILASPPLSLPFSAESSGALVNITAGQQQDDGSLNSPTGNGQTTQDNTTLTHSLSREPNDNWLRWTGHGPCGAASPLFASASNSRPATES